jgi:anti-sigma regulatory factor (Ser/Thr protein kinase)
VPDVTAPSPPRAERLLLRNDLSELPRLARWVETRMEGEGSADLKFAVALCLEEAVANIVMHRGAMRDEIKIAVQIESDGKSLTATIEDNGRSFDPTQLVPPARAASLDAATVGDLGVHLIRSFSSNMEYARRSGRNRLTLRFRETEMAGRDRDGD